MADGSDDALQTQVRRNVKVLMAMNGIDHVRDLARRIERNENWLSRKVAGQRDFQLADLTVLAAAFGVQPADLLRPVHEVVGAVTATGTGDDQRRSGTDVTYPPLISWSMRDKSSEIIPFPQVNASSPCITNVTDKSPSADAEVVRLDDWRRNGQTSESTADRSPAGVPSPARRRPVGRIGGHYAHSA